MYLYSQYSERNKYFTLNPIIDISFNPLNAINYIFYSARSTFNIDILCFVLGIMILLLIAILRMVNYIEPDSIEYKKKMY